MMRTARRRRGVFLVELLSVIAVSVVVLGMAATLMALMLRLEANRRLALAATATLEDVARRLRADAHAASEAEVGPDRAELARPDGSAVTYRVEGGTLLRDETREGAAAGRETYRMPAGTEFEWAVVPLEAGARMLTLEVRRPTTRAGTSDRAIRIEAALGRDLRYAGPAGGPP
jgi:hypothetical protein